MCLPPCGMLLCFLLVVCLPHAFGDRRIKISNLGDNSSQILVRNQNDLGMMMNKLGCITKMDYILRNFRKKIRSACKGHNGQELFGRALQAACQVLDMPVILMKRVIPTIISACTASEQPSFGIRKALHKFSVKSLGLNDENTPLGHNNVVDL